MSLDVAIQTFLANKDSIFWRNVDKRGIVKYYYAEDRVYVLKLGMTHAFVKGRSPKDAWRRYCRERDKAFGFTEDK